MRIVPATVEALCAGVSRARDARTPLSGWDLSALAGVVEYTPEDLTVTVGAGMTLAALQAVLAANRQWLPLDPPDAATLSVERLLACDASGPHRAGHGTARDWLLGLRVVLGDGRAVRSGGRVVKNVAGLDLLKLFVGGQGSLGIVVEATFKVAPLPEAVQFLRRVCRDWAEVGEAADVVASWRCLPAVVDAFRDGAGTRPVVVLGLEGSAEEVAALASDAVKAGWTPGGDAGHDARLRPLLPDRLSVLPSRMANELARRDPSHGVVRLANGVAHLPPGSVPPRVRPEGVRRLESRLKSQFDPAGILPALPD